MDLDSSSGQAEAAVKPTKGWRLGKDCGSFDGVGTPLVQVTLANLFLNARRLGSALSKALLRRLLPNDQPAPRRNFADRIVAQMAGVSLSRGRRVYDQVRANDWVRARTLRITWMSHRMRSRRSSFLAVARTKRSAHSGR